MFPVKGFGKKLGLVILSILFSLLVAEIFLRILHHGSPRYFVWQPNLEHTFKPNSDIFFGINGQKHFSINSQGFRGDEFKGHGIKLLCLGGSTTECLYLDDKESWPHQLQDSLNAKFKTWKFQIGSIGKSGCSTRENYIQLKYYVPQLGKIDGVVLMVGLNDMMKRLSNDTLFENDFQFTQQVEDSFIKMILLSDNLHAAWWRRMRLYHLFQDIFQRTHKVDWQNVQDDEGKIYKQWRANRKKVISMIDSLPDLTTSLDEYERNLALIYNETQRQGIKLILVNQSSLYKDSIKNFEEDLLWMGGKGNFQKETNGTYYSVKALANGMDLYNQRLEKFCNNRVGVKFINLASRLPRDTSVFYDDCHFNEGGARKVAGLIAEEIFR